MTQTVTPTPSITLTRTVTPTITVTRTTTATPTPTVPNAFTSTWNVNNTSTNSSSESQIKLPLILNGTYNFNVDWGDGTSNLITAWDQATAVHNYQGSIVDSGFRTADIAYGNGLFVKIPITGTVFQTSTDGTTWQTRIPDPRNLFSSWNAIAYGNGRFVAVPATTSNAAFTSTDGITWSQTVLTNSNVWRSLAYGNNMFVVISDDTQINVSVDDGLSWTSYQLPSNLFPIKVTYANGLFFIMGSSSTYVTSTDGINWTTRAFPSRCSSIAYGNGVFVGINGTNRFGSGFDGNSIITSPDGINWTIQPTLTTPGGWVNIFYADGLFVLTPYRDGGLGILCSTDGVNWNASRALPFSSSNAYWSGIAYGNGRWVITSVLLSSVFVASTGILNPIKTIRITGTIRGWEFNDSGDRLKLLSIINWGPLNMNVAGSARIFAGCANLNSVGSFGSPIVPVNCSSMFEGCASLVGGSSLNSFNMSNVTNVSYMFGSCANFDTPINNWNTSSITNMSGMFFGASKFNQSIGTWNTASVTNMSSMFNGASSFNRSLNTWNTGAVTNMSNMFFGASSYNQSMINWNTANVTGMSGMFFGALAFNQDISMWNIGLVTTMADMLRFTAYSQTNYHNLLIAWGNSSRTTQNNVTFSVDQEFLSTNTTVVARRLYLINTKGWNIIDHGNETSMVIVWRGPFGYAINSRINTEMFSIFRPGSSDTIIEVNWGNGQNYVYNDASSTLRGVVSPTGLSQDADYTIRITKRSGSGDILFRTGAYAYATQPVPGNLTSFQSGLRRVTRFGTDIRLGNGGGHFYACESLTEISSTDAPKMPLDNILNNCFYDCFSFTGNGLINWNTSNITTMFGTFRFNESLTFDLRNWNFSKVTNMTEMLRGAYSRNANRTSIYSTLLIYFNDSTTTSNVPLGAQGLNFLGSQNSVTTARTALEQRGWTITDSGAI
jgi:surface protein